MVDMVDMANLNAIVSSPFSISVFFAAVFVVVLDGCWEEH